MRVMKCLTKGLPAILLLLTLNTVVVMPGNADAAELYSPRKAAITVIDGSLQALADNAEEYQTYIDLAADYLPADSVNSLNELMFVAQLDLSPEEKHDAFIEISQSGCAAYLNLWLFGEILGYFTIFDDLASLLSDIGLLGIFLCLIGIG